LGDALPHPYAQLHVVQNPEQTLRVKGGHYIPHWPQPGIIERDTLRRDTFKNLAYFGCPTNLAEELRDSSWEKIVRELNLNWRIVGPQQWHDFSDTDAVVAVRNFQGDTCPIRPATKLYNAWRAGVPAILGHEAAYRRERQSPVDYLEVRSINETVAALQMLRDNVSLRHSMVENGKMRAQQISPQVLAGLWQDFILGTAVPAYYKWIESSSSFRCKFFIGRIVSLRVNGLRKRFSF
jgi:hypothetical protein